MSIIRNQRGSVLLMVFTVSVVFAFMLPSLYFLILKSATSQAKRGDLEAYEVFINSLRTQLEDPLTCHSILKGLKVPKTQGMSRGVPVSQIPWGYGSDAKGKIDKGPLKVGWRLPGTTLEVSRIVLVRSGKNAGDVNVRTGKSGTEEYKQAPIRIFVYMRDFSSKNKDELSVNLRESTTEGPLAPETIPPLMRKGLMIRLFANIDDSEKIYNCFGFESFAAACQAMGSAFWHAAPDPDMLCHPDKQCYTGKVGLVTDPKRCDNLASVPYKALLVGESDGKKQYMCTLCRKDL